MFEIFLRIVNISISASWMVLAVLLLRLILKKAPKWLRASLWGLVAIRLICPFSYESIISLVPRAETVNPNIMTGATTHTSKEFSILNELIGEPFAVTSEANTLRGWIPVLAVVWLIGMLILLLHTAISYFRLKRNIETAVLLKDNIYQSEKVASPFVLGIVKPKIYLPYKITEQDMAYVIAHETAHLRRKDHWWKLLGFLLLVLHWLNPLMWLGYVLLCKDIELACDEKVIKELNCEARADYSQAILTCSVNRYTLAACPLAFGEVGVKDRVRSVLSYKKPALWIIIVAIVMSLAVAIGFLTDPISEENFGVKSISAEKVDLDTVELIIKYTYGYGGCSACVVPEDEGEYCGDGMKDYDGSIGKYRILIVFGDAEPSKTFINNYPLGEVVELKDFPIKTRLKRTGYPNDHGFAFYLGFDSPVHVEDTAPKKLSDFGGTIRIPITVGAAS